MLNKILVSTLASFTILFFSLSCAADSPSAEATPSVEKPPSRSIPLYFKLKDKHKLSKAHLVDWQCGFREGFGEVEVNGKWGFINSRGQIVIEPKFNDVSPFCEGVSNVRSGAIIDSLDAAFFDLAGRRYHIDKQGRPIFKMSSDYYYSGRFAEGLAPVLFQPCRPSKPWTLDWDISMSGTTFSVPDGSCGFIDMNGDIVIPTKYADVGSFSEGLAKFEDPNGKCGYMNAMGEVVIEPRYDYALPFSMGLARVSIANKWGFINKRGEEVVALQYDFAKSFSKGLAAVEKNDKWGYIDRKGKLVIPFKFDDAMAFSEGCAAVIIRGKIGYIDISGEYVTEPKFEHIPFWGEADWRVGAPFVSSFSEGLAAVMIGGKWGYIDSQEVFIIDPKFDFAGPFTEGFAKVAVGDKLGYIDKQGNYIWEPTR